MVGRTERVEGDALDGMAGGGRLAGMNVVRFPDGQGFGVESRGPIDACVVQAGDVVQLVQRAEAIEDLEGAGVGFNGPHAPSRAYGAGEGENVFATSGADVHDHVPGLWLVD